MNIIYEYFNFVTNELTVNHLDNLKKSLKIVPGSTIKP